MAGQAGIFYVNSKITSPTLTHDVFTRWYEDVHVPDILITSGINAAFRYKATGPVDRPYLALYPVRDVGWLSSDEFKSIPVHSDLLPNESRAIFEIADFDARNYASRGRRGGGGIQEPAKKLVVVAFDFESDDPDVLFAQSLPKSLAPVRSRLLELISARQNRGAGLDTGISRPPRHLALHEFDELPNSQDLCFNPNFTVTTFELIGAFGDKDVQF